MNANRLRELLSYDPITGIFTWKVRPANRCQIGQVAGRIANTGYRQISVENVRYLAHRLAWLYVTGEWPSGDLDHRNGAKDDNRFSNLRECVAHENMQNAGLNKNNTSGFTGVTWNKKSGKWEAQIGVRRKLIKLGLFVKPEEAALAYKNAKRQYHTFNPVQRIQ